MAFTVLNYCRSPLIDEYKGGDQASLALDTLLIAGIVSLICLSVIGKIDMGMGEVGTISNSWMQGLVAAACIIFVLDVITMVVKCRSSNHSKSPPTTTTVKNEPVKRASEPTPLNQRPKATVSIEILKEQANQEIRVPVGQLFAIKLNHSYSTGHEPWVVFSSPLFLTLNEVTKKNDVPYVRGMVGNGSWHVFVFQATTQGKGNIVMKLPCEFSQSREVTLSFPIDVV